MCGITGKINYDGSPIDEGLIKRMTAQLVHRGPDDEGFHFSSNGSVSIGLGHRRLSIIDLAGGHQPLYNEDKSIVIVFNGEIYNFIDLRDDLIKKGHSFKTKTDTETIVHLYEEYGEKCIEKLNGMFAFAIWDSRNKRLLLARDRLGKKPLYYYYDKKKLIFASEIKSILQDRSISREINYEALDNYISFLCVTAPKTIFKNIHSLQGGHYLVCNPEKIEVKEYWDVSFSHVINESEDYFIERLSELLSDSIHGRLISDVPLGAFLSGGIDSSAMVAFMAEYLNEKVVTNSIGFNEIAFNELNYARLIAHKYNTNHHEYIVEPNALEILPKLAWHFDEPFGDASAIPTYYVSKMARENVTVAISGDGGDEIFAGYQRRYYFYRLENKIKSFLPNFLRQSIIPIIAKIYPKADWLPQFLRAKHLLTNLSKSSEFAYFLDLSIFMPELKNKIYSADFLKTLGGYDSSVEIERYFKKVDSEDPLSKVQYVDIKHFLGNDILVKVDRMSMANSLEIRSPLLDYRLIEFAASIPSDFKLKGRTSKYIFKKLLENRLPHDIISRKKKGFSVPLAAWFRKDLRHYAEDILFSQQAKMRGYFNFIQLNKMWKQHLRGTRDYSSHFWALLMLELWHQTYIDNHNESTLKTNNRSLLL